MQPYKEITLNTGETKREYWDTDKARTKHREIRRQVIDELNARDREVARRLGFEALIRDDGTVSTVTVTDGKLEVVYRTPADPSRNPATGLKDSWGNNAPLKHSGQETTMLVVERWRAFCAKPQSDDFVVPFAPVNPKYDRSKQTGNGAPLVSSAVQVQPDTGEGDTNRGPFGERPKRKRGRPRKAKPVTDGQLPVSGGTENPVP